MVLYYSVLYGVVLGCIMMYSVVLCCIVWYGVVSCCLCCLVLYCVVCCCVVCDVSVVGSVCSFTVFVLFVTYSKWSVTLNMTHLCKLTSTVYVQFDTSSEMVDVRMNHGHGKKP